MASDPAMPKQPTSVLTSRGVRSMAALLALLGATAVLIGTTSADSELSQSRRGAIEQMTPEEKSRLRRNLERFESLEPAEQQRLREFAQAVEASGNEALLTTLRRYQQWTQGLTPARRAELQQMEPEKRLAQVKQAVEKEASQWPKTIDKESLIAVHAWLIAWYKDREDRIRQVIGEEEFEKSKAFFDRIDEEKKDRLPKERMALPQEERTALAMATHFVRPHRRNPIGDSFWKIAPTDQELEQLAGKLPPVFRTILTRQSNRWEKLNTVSKWAFADVLSAFRPNRDEFHVGEKELEKFFVEELGDTEREYLLNLSRQQMTEELRRRFWENNELTPNPHGPPFGRGPSSFHGGPDGGRRRGDEDRDRRRGPDWDRGRGEHHERHDPSGSDGDRRDGDR